MVAPIRTSGSRAADNVYHYQLEEGKGPVFRALCIMIDAAPFFLICFSIFVLAELLEHKWRKTGNILDGQPWFTQFRNGDNRLVALEGSINGAHNDSRAKLNKALDRLKHLEAENKDLSEKSESTRTLLCDLNEKFARLEESRVTEEDLVGLRDGCKKMMDRFEKKIENLKEGAVSMSDHQALSDRVNEIRNGIYNLRESQVSTNNDIKQQLQILENECADNGRQHDRLDRLEDDLDYLDAMVDANAYDNQMQIKSLNTRLEGVPDAMGQLSGDFSCAIASVRCEIRDLPVLSQDNIRALLGVFELHVGPYTANMENRLAHLQHITDYIAQHANLWVSTADDMMATLEDEVDELSSEAFNMRWRVYDIVPSNRLDVSSPFVSGVRSRLVQ